MVMNLPDRVAYGTLTGRVVQAVLDGVDGDGRPEGARVSGLSITIEPTVSLLQDSESGLIVYPNREKLRTNDAGLVINDRAPSGEITLVATSQSWAPEFRYKITLSRNGQVDLEGYFALNGGEVKNFADLVEWFEPLPEKIAEWDKVRSQIEAIRDSAVAASRTVADALQGIDVSEVGEFAQTASEAATRAQQSADTAAAAQRSTASDAAAATGAAAKAVAAETSASEAATQAERSATDAGERAAAAQQSASAAEVARKAAESAAGAAAGDLIDDTQVASSTTWSSQTIESKISAATAWESISGKPNQFPPTAHSAALITSGTVSSYRLPRATSSAAGAVLVESGDLRDVSTVVPTSSAVVKAVNGVKKQKFSYAHSNNNFIAQLQVTELDPDTGTAMFMLALGGAKDVQLSSNQVLGTVTARPAENVSVVVPVWNYTGFVQTIVEVNKNGNVTLMANGNTFNVKTVGFGFTVNFFWPTS